MDAVEKIREICKEKRIPISRLERECGFGNGYIAQLRRGTLPVERAIKVADYLGVSLDYLLGKEESSPVVEELQIPEEDIKAAFWGGKGLAKEDIDALWEDARAYIEFKTEQRRRKKN